MPKAQIVKSWQVDDSKMTYTFELRPNIYFHNGQLLKPEHVVASLKRIVEQGSPIKSFLQEIKDIALDRSNRLIISLRSPYPPLISVLASPNAKIFLPSKPYAHGSGPFKFSSLNDNTGRNVLRLERVNRNRFKNFKIERIELHELSETEALENAHIGFIHDTSIYTSASNLSNTGSAMKEVRSPSTTTWIISINASRPLLDQESFRHCLTSYFPRESLIDSYLQDHEPARGYLPPTLLGSFRKLSIGDNAKQNCSVPAGKQITLAYPSALHQGAEICEHIAKAYSAKEILIKCDGIGFAELMDGIVKKTAHLSLFAMTLDVPDAEYFLNVFESGSNFNISSYRSNKIDRLMAEARTYADRKKRSKIYHLINQELFDRALTINISYPPQVSYIHQCIKNFNINVAGPPYNDLSKVSLMLPCPRISDFLERRLAK